MYGRLGTSDTLHKTICCIGPGLCNMLEVNFREFSKGEVRRIPLPRTRVEYAFRARLTEKIHRRFIAAIYAPARYGNVLIEKAGTMKRPTTEEERQGGVVAVQEYATGERSYDERPEGRLICH
jgi:hypothetical protein